MPESIKHNTDDVRFKKSRAIETVLTRKTHNLINGETWSKVEIAAWDLEHSLNHTLRLLLAHINRI